MDQRSVIVEGMKRKDILGPGASSKVKRHADRARYDAATVYAIVDEALICHVGFATDGQPFVLPTAHARIDDAIYLHGAVANRMFRAIAAGERACLAFTLVDGLVMARSAFSHSMNYRSAVVFGTGEEVRVEAEKRAALRAIVDHTSPGRADEASPPTPEELKATLVVRVAIAEASVKVRGGPAVDEPRHVAAGEHWAGVVPLTLTAGAPERDAQLPFEMPMPRAVVEAARRLGADAPIESRRGELLFSTDPRRLDVARIHRFLRDESYWSPGVSREDVEASIEASVCFGVYRAGAQIGYARVLTDGARFGYLADVFVLPEARGAGVGKQLVEFILAHPRIARIDRLLLGTRDAHGLYARHGFEAAPADRYMVKRGP
jgi:uncharacterized protein